MVQTATAMEQATRSAACGERLARKSAYDFVVVGACGCRKLVRVC
jgi:hypothetical protein